MRTRLKVTTLVIFALPPWLASAENDGVTDENRPFLLNYPNLEDSDGRVIFENEHVVLQRLVVPAGMWEGVHSHPGNQIFVHIKGGTWSAIKDGKPTGDEIVRQAGESGWMESVHEHEYGNVGDTTIDLVWITLK